MTALTVFELCVAIVVAILVIPYLIFGQGILLLIIIFPATAAEAITNERGLDLGRKSFIYLILLYLFILTEVLLAATILFGAYCLFWGYPTANTSADATHAYSPSINSTLLLINKLLLVCITYFFSMFIYNSFKYRSAYRQLKRTDFLFFQILPLLVFPLGFIYLIGCLDYLMNVTPNNTLGTVPVIAGYIYAVYILYSLGKTFFYLAKSIQNGFKDHGIQRFIQLFVTLAYNFALLYFFSQTLLS